mgnify:CR=1 FL=1
MNHDEQKYIHVTGKVQGDFLLIEISNSYSGRGSLRSGTGLANIKAVAEKYHGAMEVRTDGEKFTLSVHFNHSATIRKHFTTSLLKTAI